MGMTTGLKGLKEVTKGLKLPDTDAIAAKGRLAYRMGIERRNNPENSPVARTVWERGWDAAKNEFEAMQQRWKSL
jgi:hypothetical protein